MTKLELLQSLYRNGAGVTEDRHLPPAQMKYITRNDDDFAANKPALSYEVLDQLVAEGLAYFSYHKGYGNCILTYEGRRLQLELEGWNRSQWGYASQVCCAKAVPTFCVCLFRSLCPDHGNHCHGSHD